MNPPLRRGEFVRVTWEGGSVQAMVAFASPNGRSVIILYDGILAGFVGMAPLSESAESDVWTTLAGTTVVVSRLAGAAGA